MPHWGPSSWGRSRSATSQADRFTPSTLQAIMLTLLGKTSSINVRKVLWTLDETGLAFEHEAWGSGARSTSCPSSWPSTRTAWSLSCVMANRCWESNVICRYLATACRTDRPAAR